MNYSLGTTIDPNMTVRMTLIARFNKLTMSSAKRTPEGLRELESIFYELGKNHWSAIHQDYQRMGARITEYKKALIDSGQIVSTGNALGDWKVVSTPRPITTTTTTPKHIDGDPQPQAKMTASNSWIGIGILAVAGSLALALALLAPRR